MGKKAVDVAFVLASIVTVTLCKPPNIVFIVADDLGWNDIGFNNPDIISPNVDRLAREGIILDHAYVQPLCSPSRSSFMTGYYPYRTGLQHMVIDPQQPVCAPLTKSFLPQEMKNLGYATHIVGKWHLGFCNWNCTPTFRGFDSFLGYYNAQENYYFRTCEYYYDFRDNQTLSVKQNGTYSTYVFQERVRNIINTHDTSKPLFLYLPLQSVHMPLEVPKHYYNMYPNIQNEDRRIFSGMVTAMDDVIGNLTSFLTQRDMYNDTLFVFTADNGGWIQFGGNNYPLRGGKFTIWEGGTRAVSFVTGPGLKVRGTRFEGLMHAVDWMPTIVAAAGGEIKDKDIDGINMWDAISTGSASPRSEFIYNLDDMFLPGEGHAGIRQGDYKLIVGFPGLYSGWYLPNQTQDSVAGQKVMAAINASYQPDGRPLKPFTLENPQGWDDEPHLYNLKDDPTEHNNLADQMPDLVVKLKQRMAEYKLKYVPPNYPKHDPNSNPFIYGGAWTPGWC
ncbi:arylsulfatase B-like [Littorina saxatilis]|uniref:Sulfatase N-terminal domain-containing protein n=1 Tax=Littorina saxatilis TaxID=31220 RepID=A0AAN9G3C1_9CAEN